MVIMEQWKVYGWQKIKVKIRETDQFEIRDFIEQSTVQAFACITTSCKFILKTIFVFINHK
jgi:hypothetical protein